MRDQPEQVTDDATAPASSSVKPIANSREGLFSSVSPLIGDRGHIADLLRGDAPFALFFPDRGKRLAAAIRTFQKPGSQLGTGWEAATRTILARFRRSSYVELTFEF